MNTQFILPLLLLPYWLVAAQSTDVRFTNNPAEAQARAVRESKFYFVHFTATWCMPCQWMEKNTFANDTIATFVNENYIAVKIDFDDPSTASYKHKYQVTSLPSLLIFNAKGELLDRYETSLSKDELLQALQKHVLFQPRTTGNTNPVAIRVNYTNPDKISRPALIPEEANNSTTASKPARMPAAPSVAASKTPTPTPSAIVEPTTLFAVQVGVFSDFTNAKRSKIRMEERYNKPVQIIENQENGKKLFRVMVGKFEQKEDADHFLEQLHAQSVHGFVKNMDN